MSVIEFPDKPHPPKPPMDEADELTLLLVAKWRIARSKLQAGWAEEELRESCGDVFATTEIGAQTEFPREELLGKLHDAEFFLAKAKPHGALAACQLLRIARDILGHQQIEPGHTFGSGPVLEILNNVLSSLDFLASDTRLRPEKTHPLEETWSA